MQRRHGIKDGDFAVQYCQWFDNSCNDPGDEASFPLNIVEYSPQGEGQTCITSQNVKGIFNNTTSSTYHVTNHKMHKVSSCMFLAEMHRPQQSRMTTERDSLEYVLQSECL